MSSPVPASARYYSRKEAARCTGVSTRTLSRAIRTGRLRAYHVGRLVRIAEADLRAYIERDPCEGGA